MERLFPMFVKLAGRQVLVVGAGAVGEAKIRGLLDTGARIRVVARQATAAVRKWAGAGAIVLEERAFVLGDLDGIFLVVAATSSRELNESIFAEAQHRRVPCNVVDVPGLCDFFYPAVLRRGDLQIAISTAGHSPLLAQRIRRQLELQFGPEYAGWVEDLGKIRREVLGSDLPADRKRELLRSLTGQDRSNFAEYGRRRGESERDKS
ncbi:MAG: bifunctional precorrin-2 dehydrogenase/sirohydrochlorin ferrochelatase [Chlamydiota bacterium]